MSLINNRNIFVALCLVFALVVINNNFVGVDAQKEIPTTKFSQNVGGSTMSFFYCYSCGYRKAYEDYVNIIGQKYPDILVTGANYDPPGMNMLFSRIIFFMKIALIVIIISSMNPFDFVGVTPPSWWFYILENKMYACMMIFFVGNMVEGQLVSSGAFEIMLNDVPVWSKLETGRIPAPQELFQIIDNHMQFNDKIQDPDFVK